DHADDLPTTYLAVNDHAGRSQGHAANPPRRPPDLTPRAQSPKASLGARGANWRAALDIVRSANGVPAPLQRPGAAGPVDGEVLQQIEPRIGLTLSDS
ncbi:hypothetical protein PVAR5_9055, partial [Paecilomyces variotii No. 5]